MAHKLLHETNFACHLSLISIFSVSKFIRIGIADKNDNPPYFDKSLYEAEVDENEDIQHTVLTVTASDKDECECYFYSTWRTFQRILT